MLGPPIDLAQTALAVGLVSAACVGLLVTIPTHIPPDAPAVATSISAVASATPPASRTLAVQADAITIAPHRITLHRGSATATAPIGVPLAVRHPSHGVARGCSPDAVRRVTAPVRLPIDGQLQIHHRRCGGHSVVLIHG